MQVFKLTTITKAMELVFETRNDAKCREGGHLMACGRRCTVLKVAQRQQNPLSMCTLDDPYKEMMAARGDPFPAALVSSRFHTGSLSGLMSLAR